jgi:hypothetical protein
MNANEIAATALINRLKGNITEISGNPIVRMRKKVKEIVN